MVRSKPFQLLEAPPYDDALPMPKIIDAIDLEAHVWVLAHHLQLHPLRSVRHDHAIGEDICDRHDVRAASCMTAEPANHLTLKQSVDFGCIQLSQHPLIIASSIHPAFEDSVKRESGSRNWLCS